MICVSLKYLRKQRNCGDLVGGEDAFFASTERNKHETRVVVAKTYFVVLLSEEHEDIKVLLDMLSQG